VSTKPDPGIAAVAVTIAAVSDETDEEGEEEDEEEEKDDKEAEEEEEEEEQEEEEEEGAADEGTSKEGNDCRLKLGAERTAARERRAAHMHFRDGSDMLPATEMEEMWEPRMPGEIASTSMRDGQRLSLERMPPLQWIQDRCSLRHAVTM